MQITETFERRLVGVEANDEYGVDLTLGKKRVSLTVEQARQVREAMAEVELEQTMARDQDLRARADRLLAQPRSPWEADA